MYSLSAECAQLSRQLRLRDLIYYSTNPGCPREAECERHEEACQSATLLGLLLCVIQMQSYPDFLEHLIERAEACCCLRLRVRQNQHIAVAEEAGHLPSTSHEMSTCRPPYAHTCSSSSSSTHAAQQQRSTCSTAAIINVDHTALISASSAPCPAQKSRNFSFIMSTYDKMITYDSCSSGTRFCMQICVYAGNLYGQEIGHAQGLCMRSEGHNYSRNEGVLLRRIFICEGYLATSFFSSCRPNDTLCALKVCSQR